MLRAKIIISVKATNFKRLPTVKCVINYTFRKDRWSLWSYHNVVFIFLNNHCLHIGRILIKLDTLKVGIQARYNQPKNELRLRLNMTIFQTRINRRHLKFELRLCSRSLFISALVWLIRFDMWDRVD